LHFQLEKLCNAKTPDKKCAIFARGEGFRGRRVQQLDVAAVVYANALHNQLMRNICCNEFSFELRLLIMIIVAAWHRLCLRDK